MHQSIPAAPSPPTRGYCGTFARLVSPGGGAFANFALPGGRAFDNPGTIPELLTRTWFPIRIITTQKILLEIKQISSSVKDRKKLRRVVKTVKACSRFNACSFFNAY